MTSLGPPNGIATSKQQPVAEPAGYNSDGDKAAPQQQQQQPQQQHPPIVSLAALKQEEEAAAATMMVAVPPGMPQHPPQAAAGGHPGMAAAVAAPMIQMLSGGGPVGQGPPHPPQGVSPHPPGVVGVVVSSPQNSNKADSVGSPQGAAVQARPEVDSDKKKPPPTAAPAAAQTAVVTSAAPVEVPAQEGEEKSPDAVEETAKVEENGKSGKVEFLSKHVVVLKPNLKLVRLADH